MCYNWEQCLSDAYLTASLALQFACPGILITDSSDRHCIAPLAITVSAMAIGAGFAWTGPLQQVTLFSVAGLQTKVTMEGEMDRTELLGRTDEENERLNSDVCQC